MFRPGGSFCQPCINCFSIVFGISELTMQDHKAVTQVYPEITKGK